MTVKAIASRLSVAAGFLTITLAYFLGVRRSAISWPLWFDEIITYHFASLPNLATLWAALKDGPEHAGPLNLLLVRACYAAMGPTNLATRLPAMLGVYACMVGVFAFGARRLPAWCALAAMATLLCTRAHEFGFEGRGYGVWIGLTAWALFFWQLAAEGRRRALALPGLALCLAGGIGCHLYGVMSIGVLGLAELERSRARRRFDWPVIIAIGAGVLVLPFFVPLIRNARSFSADFWAFPDPRELLGTYDWLLAEAIPPLVAMLFLALLLPGAPIGSLAAGPAPSPSMPRYEVVAVAGFVALPVFDFLLARLVTNAYTQRYTLPTVIGLALLAAVLAARSGRAAATGLLMAALMVGASGFHSRDEATIARMAMSSSADLSPLEAQPLPIATFDLNLYSQINLRGSPALNARLTFLHGLGDTIPRRYLEKMAPWVPADRPIRLADCREFLEGHDAFLLVSDMGPHARTVSGKRVPLPWVGRFWELLAEGAWASHASSEGPYRTVEIRRDRRPEARRPQAGADPSSGALAPSDQGAAGVGSASRSSSPGLSRRIAAMALRSGRPL